MSFRNSLAAVNGCGTLFFAGKVTGTNGALSNLSGAPGLQQMVTCTRTGTGAYTLTLCPFLGPQGSVNIDLSVQAADVSIRFNTHVYTGNSLQITVTTRSIGTSPAPTDSDFFFCVMAF
jgi:hypothetical protein